MINKHLSKKLFLALIFIPAFYFISCSNYEKTAEGDGDYYASVNDEYLDEAGLKSLVPAEFYDKLTVEHKKEIVEEWVNNEILYQEAVKEGIDKEPEIARILSNARRNLLSNEILERKLADIKSPDEKGLMDYYKQHQNYFILEDDEYLVRYALFETIDDAQKFWKDIKSGGSFSNLSKERSKHTSASDGGDIGTVNEDSVEPQIWEAIQATISRLGTGKISDVFNVTEGWGVLIVDQICKKGSVKPFSTVRNQVLDYYLAEKREQTKKDLIDKLSKKSKISYNLK